MKRFLFTLLFLPSLALAQVTLPIRSTPSTPPANGTVNFYPKSNGGLYIKQKGQPERSLAKSQRLIVYHTIASLQADTSSASNAVSSVLITDAGKAGNFVLDPTDSSTPDNGATVIVTSTGSRYKRVGPSNRYVGAEWSLKGDATTDEVNSFTTILASTTASSGKSVFSLEGKTYKITKGIVVDASRLRIIANGGCISCATMTSGTCVTIRGTGNGLSTPYTQATSGVDYLEVIGPGKSVTAVQGVVFDSPNEPGTSHMNFNGLVVHDFSTGITFNRHAYGLGFSRGGVYGCGVGERFLNGINGGENMNHQGWFNFNNDTAYVCHNPNADIYYTNSSIDYNEKKVGLQTAGRVHHIGTHIEWKNLSDYPFTISGNGTSTRFFGGWMLSGDNSLSSPPSVFNILTNPGMGGAVWMNGVSVNNISTSSGKWAAGTGNFYPRDIDSYEITDSPLLTSDVQNITLNGTPSTSALMDKIFVTGNVATVAADPASTSVSTSNTILALTTVSGTPYYDHQKGLGTGSVNRVKFIYRIQPDRATAFRGILYKPGSNAGTVYYNFYFASNLASDGSFGWVSSAGTQAVTFTSSATAETYFGTGQPLLRAPSRAEYFVVDINADNLDGTGLSHIYYRDLILNQQ